MSSAASGNNFNKVYTEKAVYSTKGATSGSPNEKTVKKQNTGKAILRFLRLFLDFSRNICVTQVDSLAQNLCRRKF